MATIEDTLRMREEFIKSIEEQQLALTNSLMGFGQIIPHSASVLAAANPISQMITAHSASVLAAANPISQMIAAHSTSALADTSPILQGIAAHSAAALADTSPILQGIAAHSAAALAAASPMIQEIATQSAFALANLEPKIQEALELNAAALAHTSFIFQEFLDQNNSLCAHISPVFQDIASDYKLFNKAGLFPKSQDLPTFMDLSPIYDDDKIAHSDSELTNFKNIPDSDSEKIFQKAISISEAIQYDRIISKPTKKKKIFKRKVSIRTAHALRQRYKTKQLKSLYESLLSYSLNKLDKERTEFFIKLVGITIGLPIPDNMKWYFAILLLPILYRNYVLSTHQTALSEKQNTLKEQQK